jgi:CBS domain containing-hemolysin-like protein
MDTLIFIFTVLLLIGFAAICSGLNVAFMSLSIDDLRRKAKLGNAYARRLLPLRKNSHLTLAAILFTNVAAASASPLVLDSKLSGIAAGVLSTFLLVIFAEIMPQALFIRNALAYCGRLAPLLRTMIILTYPVSKPLQLLLDRLFGRQKSQLHTRHELGIMITEHLGHDDSELDEDEVEIIRGALQLSEKRVRDITTPMRSVYWLTPEMEINGTSIDEITARGWSRIPVLNTARTTSYGLLLMKDLVDLDFDNNPILVRDLPLYPTQVVGSMTALDTMFRKFITGGAHLMPVEKDGNIIGIVTIEDLLEEIVGHEIEDETDRAKRTGNKRRGK